MPQPSYTNQTPSLSMYRLGYLGLIPFVALSVMCFFELSPYKLEPKGILEIYSFGIFTFLCGTLWPKNGIDMQNYKSLLSNGLFLIAFFCFVFAPGHWLLIAGFLFIAIYLFEIRTKALEKLNESYKKLRRNLTIVASLSVFLAYIG